MVAHTTAAMICTDRLAPSRRASSEEPTTQMKGRTDDGGVEPVGPGQEVEVGEVVLGQGRELDLGEVVGGERRDGAVLDPVLDASEVIDERVDVAREVHHGERHHDPEEDDEDA